MLIGIYKIENMVNGKVYIGQSFDIEGRWSDHKGEAFNINSRAYNYYLYRAIRKYGLESFSFDVLIEINEDDWTKNLLNFYETYYVFYYNSMKENGNGYNIRFPGSNGRLSKESKEKCRINHSANSGSKYWQGRKRSMEDIEKFRKSHLGIKQSEEHKKKISEALKSYWKIKKVS